MNRPLVGEPSVSAFLRSVRRNLGSNISRMELLLLSNTSPNYYDPTQDLEKLKETLTSVQDILVDGESRRLGEESVDEWMDDIKHLIYDAEDFLDDLKSLNNHQVRVDELYKTSQDLKNRLGDILARAEVLRDRAKHLELKRGIEYAFSGEPKVTLRTPETSSVVDISEIHGREDDEAEIVKRLLEVDGKRKKKYDVLCIVGMGGLGKTTLAQLVFTDPEVVKHFDMKSWVFISNVFDVARATKELIENSGGGGSDLQSLAGLQMRLKERVENKRFLFVLDDVWSSSEWETMKAPFSSCANGSKILVTTRKTKIAHALGNKDPYQLQGLDNEQCKKIFRYNAFVDDEEENDKLIFVEKIVVASGGVPLVVKVIGSMLREADVEKWRAVSENSADWANINDEIHPAIRFSYYDLPASIKRCFEYLAVFPADFTFKEHDIVRMWIADGLVEEVEGRMVEDIGVEYFNELNARSLIQENNRMHDIVHHLAISLRDLDVRIFDIAVPESILGVPESILNIIGLKKLVAYRFKLHIESIAGLKALSTYHEGREEARGKVTELNMLHLLGRAIIIAMDNIGVIEEAKMADLMSKNVRHLEFGWSQPGNDEEIEVKKMEALEPHHALESLAFSNYGGDKFPAWFMAGNICFSNLRSLKMYGLNKIWEMTGMEFVSLESLFINNCPILRNI